MAKLGDTLNAAANAVTNVAKQNQRPTSLAGLMKEQIFYPERYDAQRAASYSQASQVVANINYDYADEEEKKKYRNAIQQMSIDTDYFHRRGYIDTPSALQTHQYLNAAESGVDNIRFKTYDEWGQGTANGSYIGEVQSQLAELQNQLSGVQRNRSNMRSIGDVYMQQNAENDIVRQIGQTKGKLANVQLPMSDPTFDYYNNRTTEQLVKDKQTIENAIRQTNKYESDEGVEGTLTARGKYLYDQSRQKQQGYLDIVDRILAQRGREDRYSEYLSMLDADDFDGSYDPTVDKNDVFYQAVNGSFGDNELGERIYYVEQNFDEMSDAERQLYNYIHKTQGKESAEEFFDFLQRDLNLRDRIKNEAALREFAKDSPVAASMMSSFYKIASPMSAVRQIIDVFSEDGIDQNAPYNFASYAGTALRDQVTRDIRSDSGETAAWVYGAGMSVADNLLQMGLSGGNQNIILGLMSSSVFADSVVQMKDEGKSDAEILTTSTVRAAIEFATEKIGLDNVFRFARQGGIKNLVASVLAEGGEEGISNIGNLFYDTMVSVFKGETTALEKEVERYKALGWSDADAIGQVVADKMKDLGLDIAAGAMSGFMLSGGAYVGANGINISEKASNSIKNFINTSLDEQVQIGLSYDSDSEAYQNAVALKQAKNFISQQVQKFNQINLNSREETAELKKYVDEYSETFKNAPAESRTQALNNVIESAKNEAQQRAAVIAFLNTSADAAKAEALRTNATTDSASEGEIGQILRFTNATVRTVNGEIVALDNVEWEGEDKRTLYSNAISGLQKTAHANDYVAGFKETSSITPQSYDTVWKTAYDMARSNPNTTLEKVKANEKVAAVLEVYKNSIPDSIIEIAMRDGLDSLEKVTEGMKAVVQTMAEHYKVDVIFSDNLTDLSGEAVQGMYKDGKIYISEYTKDPATVVFCHELTHAMEERNPEVWIRYKEIVLEKLRENENSYNFAREQLKEAEPGISEDGIERELVAMASENFLIDEAFVNDLKKDKPFYRKVRNIILNRYRNGGIDSVRSSLLNTTAEDTNFFEKLGKLWIDMATQSEKTEATLEEMRGEILPEQYSRQFRVIDLSDNSDLAMLVGNSRGSERYSAIKRYILDVLSEQPFTLSDGTEAVVDKGDADHIASKALEKKTAEIAEIKSLINSAVFTAYEEADHPKFNYFKYYEAFVRYENETFPIYLNVGRAKNSGVYHLYDITQKLRDTAHRLNDVARARGLRTGSDLPYGNNITDSGGNIKYSRSFDSAGRQLTEQQESYFKDSKVRDEDGDLLRVYHGTIREFYEFDREYANPEGNMGAGYYFTSSEDDADWNYANEDGPDLTNKIESEADRLEYSDEYEGMSHDEIVEELRKKYIDEPVRIDAYLNITNPVYVGSYQNYLLEDISDIREEDYNSEDEYYEALDESLTDTVEEVIDNLPWGYEPWFDKIREVLYDAAANGGIAFESLKTALNDLYIEDDQGRLAGNEVARMIAEALGYDGIIDDTVSTKFKNMNLAPDTTHYIIFDSNQAKLITNENPTVNRDIRYSRSFETSREAAPVFYSQLERTVEAYKGDKIGASSLIPYLKGRGIKDEEIKWSGLATFLEGKKSVSKEEVVQFVKDNQLEIVGTTLSINGIDTNVESEYFKAKEDLLEEARETADWNGIKYDDIYIDEDDSVWYAYPVIDDDVDYETELAELDTEGETQWKRFSTPGGENYRELIYRLPDSDYTNDAMETHWERADLLDGATGIVAHARVQDFGHTLFVEEIQSDWHNAGEKEGYARTEFSDDVLAMRAELEDSLDSLRTEHVKASMRVNDATQESFEARNAWLETNDENPEWEAIGERYARSLKEEHGAQERYRVADFMYRNALDELRLFDEENGFSGIPDAPFRNGKYVEYVLKDLLREAAEDGKRFLAWTPGWMQEARWSDDYAEGYRIEYDQDIPKFLKKYGKQWGARVAEVTVNGEQVPAIEITDAMRESVIYEGQPMFSRAFENRMETNELVGQIADALSQIDVSNVRLSDEQVMKIAKRVKWGTGSEYSTEELATNLKRAFAYWTEHKNLDYNALTQIMSEIMLPVVNEIYDYSGDLRRRLALKGTTLIISPETAQRFGGINELNQSILKYGVAFTANENFTSPNPERVVMRLADNWKVGDFNGVSSDLRLDPSITDEGEMVQAMLNLFNTEKMKSRVRVVPDEFAETYAYNLALKAYEEFIGESRVPQGEVNRRVRENVRRETPRVLEEVRSQFEEQYLQMMAEGEEAIRQKKNKLQERADKAHYFDMLKREMKRLERLVTRPTKNKHIRTDYMKYLGKLGEMIDITSNRTVSRANNALRELAEEYKRLASQELYKDLQFDSTIYDYIQRTATMIDGRAIRDLSSREIKQVFDCVRAFIHAATAQNNFIDLDEARDINDAALETINDVRGAKGSGYSPVGSAFDAWLTTSLNPTREISRLVDFHDNDPLALLNNKLRKGEINTTQYQMEMAQIYSEMDKNNYEKHSDEWYRAKELRNRYDQMNDTFVTVKLGGREVQITEGQALALAMHSRNSDNMLHILYGGVRVPNMELYKKGNLGEAYARGDTIIPTEMEIRDIAQNLDDFEQWFLDKSIYYFETYSKELINKTSLKLEGFARAEVENYYPIRVVDTQVNAKSYDVTTGAESTGESLHSGMLMARRKSKLPIYLNSITQDLNRSQGFVSRYAGLAIPLRDFQRIYNMRIDDGTQNGVIVKEVIQQKWGTRATKYIDNMLKDLTNGRDNFSQTWLDSLRGKSAQGVLTINISVSMKQAASYPTAIAELDWKSVMRALANPEGNSFLIKRADMEEIQKWTPILWSRMAGMSTQEIAEMSLKQHKNVLEKGMDKAPFLCDWIRKVDVATVGRLWYATKYWVEDHTDLEVGSDEYFKKVAEKFEDVVSKTQPNYTVMTRPDILRTKNSIVRAVMMFKTQPLQNFNILYEASARLSAKQRAYNEAKGTSAEGSALAERNEAGKAFGRAITSQLVQTAVFTAMTFLANILLHRWYKYKDDEINEVTMSSVAEEVMWDFAKSLFGNAVFGDYVEQIGEYFVRKFALNEDDASMDGISVFGIDSLNDIWDQTKSAVEKFSSGDSKAGLTKVRQLSFTIAQMCGLPATNVYNLIHAGLETATDIAQNRPWIAQDGTKAKHYWNKMKRAYEDGKDTDEIFEEMKLLGIDSARAPLSKNDATGIMEWVSDLYVNGSANDKQMVDDWLDDLYKEGSSKANNIKNKKKAFYEYLNEEVPTEYLSKSEKVARGIDVEAEEAQAKEEKKKSKYDEWSTVTDEAFSNFLNGKAVSLPYKKGDDGVSDQLARLYQTSGNPEAVKQFAVQVLGYSAGSINWTANRYWTKDLSAFN